MISNLTNDTWRCTWRESDKYHVTAPPMMMSLDQQCQQMTENSAEELLLWSLSTICGTTKWRKKKKYFSQVKYFSTGEIFLPEQYQDPSPGPQCWECEEKCWVHQSTWPWSSCWWSSPLVPSPWGPLFCRCHCWWSGSAGQCWPGAWWTRTLSYQISAQSSWRSWWVRREQVCPMTTARSPGNNYQRAVSNIFLTLPPPTPCTVRSRGWSCPGVWCRAWSSAASSPRSRTCPWWCPPGVPMSSVIDHATHPWPGVLHWSSQSNCKIYKEYQIRLKFLN